MAAPKAPDMSKCTPKARCLSGNVPGLTYDPADPCEEGYTFNVDTCSCDPYGLCDCSCDNDCGECEICDEATGTCIPDPMCGPLTGKYFACLAEREDIGSGGTPTKFASAGPLSFSGYGDDEPVAVGFSVSNSHPGQTPPYGWYKQSSIEIIVPKSNSGSMGTAYIGIDATWPLDPRRAALSFGPANINYDRRVTAWFEIYDTAAEAEAARNCWDDRLTHLCNE